MVLEISATPYIFTFKLYDWLRKGTGGQPRPLNIERGFENLDATRKGDVVQKELISKPNLVDQGDGYQVYHLPTHPEHFYDIKRYDILSKITLPTDDSLQILMVVEGASVDIEIDGKCSTYYYAETIVIPAAAEKYRLINPNEKAIKVVCAYLKPDWFDQEKNQWLQQQMDAYLASQ